MKKKFAQKTVQIGRRGTISSVVRSHDTVKEAFAYANGRNTEAKANGVKSEYAVLFRPSMTSNRTPNRLWQTSVTSAQRLRSGVKRYPFIVVSLKTDGTVKEVTGRSSTCDKALDRAIRATSLTGREHAVVVRTATIGGSFPTFSGV